MAARLTKDVSLLVLLTVFAITMMLIPFSASAQQFVSVDVSGSVTTYPQSINDLGRTVGLSRLSGRKRVDSPETAVNEPPPAGAILDLNGTPIPGGGDGTYQQYSVNFTASLANTAITFAFRDDPQYISFVNASVADLTNPNGNLLVNGDFSGGTYTDNGNPYTPVGWTYTNTYSAGAGGVVRSGCSPFDYCWYDGAIQAYDLISQTIPTQVGDISRPA